MLLEPGERELNLEEQKKQIAYVLAQENQMIFVAEHDGQIVGYLGAVGGHFKRNRHSVEIVIGVLQAFTGQGVGTRLFEAVEAWARQKHLHRLELTVMTHNQAAVALYKKQCLEIEGRKRHSLIIDGQYVDEYYMARLLD
jgi:RimJ/RimL family protein N-acetyltransferase